MATADRSRARRLTVAGVVAVVALTGTVFALARPDDPKASLATPDSVAVTSSTRHQFAQLAELRAASDLVVSGRVVASEPGRVFGGVDRGGASSGQAMRSRVLTIEVDDVLAAADPAAGTAPGTVVLVEEEGTLLDGSPLVVDGARPSRPGDRGFWFLVASGDPEFPGFALVNSQGRYLRRGMAGDGLRGADRSDELVRSVEGLGATELTRAIQAL